MNKYDIFNLVKEKLCYDYDHSIYAKSNISPSGSTDHGACDIKFEKGDKALITLHFHFRYVSKDYAENWSLSYLRRRGLPGKVTDINDPHEKGFFWVSVMVRMSDVCKAFGVTLDEPEKPKLSTAKQLKELERLQSLCYHKDFCSIGNVRYEYIESTTKQNYGAKIKITNLKTGYETEMPAPYKMSHETFEKWCKGQSADIATDNQISML